MSNKAKSQIKKSMDLCDEARSEIESSCSFRLRVLFDMIMIELALELVRHCRSE